MKHPVSGETGMGKEEERAALTEAATWEGAAIIKSIKLNTEVIWQKIQKAGIKKPACTTTYLRHRARVPATAIIRMHRLHAVALPIWITVLNAMQQVLQKGPIEALE